MGKTTCKPAGMLPPATVDEGSIPSASSLPIQSRYMLSLMKIAEPKKHARRSPSGSKRWIECPGSYRMEEGLPDLETVYTIEGTAAHMLGESILRMGCSRDRFLGHMFNGVKVTDEMVDHVMVYVQWVRDQVQQKYDWWLEQAVEIDVTGEGGTADAIIYNHDTQTLIIGDLKYGRLHVEVVDNTQAILYAIGALDMLKKLHPKSKPVKRIKIAVIQPRGKDEMSSVREWEFDIDEMIEWRMLFMEAVLRGNDPDAPLVPGDWCTFCKARGACPALKEKALEIAMVDFSTKGDVIVSPPNTLSPKKLAKALQAAAVVRTWLKAVQDYAMEEAKAGRVPPGFKLVETRAYRKFKDPKAAEAFLSFMGLEEDQLYNREMKTAPQLEKTIGKEAFSMIEHLIEKRSGGVTLAPDSDPRPAIMPDVTTLFSTIEED